VADNVTRIKSLQDRVLNEPIRTERERHQAALNDLLEETKRLGRQIQKVVKEEQARNEKLEKKRSVLSARDLSELHIRKTQIGTHSKRFLDIWTEFNNTQVKFR
jgi:t-SNARE complex subunit (syntaxin)